MSDRKLEELTPEERKALHRGALDAVLDAYERRFVSMIRTAASDPKHLTADPSKIKTHLETLNLLRAERQHVRS